MILGTIIGWLIVGLIVGALARLIVPRRQDMGIGMTIVLGIVGAIVGGFIGVLLFGPNLFAAQPGNYAINSAWPGWILAVIGGVIVLWFVSAVSGPTRPSQLR